MTYLKKLAHARGLWKFINEKINFENQNLSVKEFLEINSYLYRSMSFIEEKVPATNPNVLIDVTDPRRALQMLKNTTISKLRNPR